MKIIIDAMGGDFAPEAPVRGALLAREKYGADIILTGRTADILRELEKAGCKEVPQGIEIANAEEVVEICDDPATAFKQKKDSSLTVGLNLLRDGQADGFISAGSTGALLAGGCDVIVADGYSGNIMLKSVEGAAKLMSGELKKMLTKSAKTKLAYLLLKDGLADFKKMLDPNEVGGTALLGISRPVVKAHGSSNAAAFCNAVRQTIAVAESGIIADITQNVDKMKVTPEKD